MPKYIVSVTITNTPRQKDITIYAASEAEAEEKTIALVTSWDGVDDVEVDSVDED